MNDDEQVARLIRRAGGIVDHAPDFDEVYRRSRRRRTAKTATAVFTVVALVAIAVVAANAFPTQRTVRFAQTGREPAPSTERTRAPAAHASPSQSPPATDRETTGTVGEVPEGSLVAVPDGFVIVSGNVSASVWFSRDARTWIQQPAQGLYSDLLNDVDVTPDGMVVALDVTSTLWTSGDLGRSWNRIDLPAEISRANPTEVAADDTSWMLGGSRAREAFLFAVPRDAPTGYATVDGDFTHQQDLSVPRIASGTAGTVMITDGHRPVLWHITDDLAVTRVDDVFGDARVTGIAASGNAFTASVLKDPEQGESSLEAWTSSEGLTWSRSESAIPAPTCAQIVASDRLIVAAGRPCDADVGWEAWLLPEDGSWNRVG
jgi:hypothetical protein